jgi:hypothetical protein
MSDPARSNLVQQTLRRCAAELHHSGLLKHLAAAMIVRPHALSHWIRKGHVPRLKAQWLEQRFPGLARADDLVRQAKGGAL